MNIARFVVALSTLFVMCGCTRQPDRAPASEPVSAAGEQSVPAFVGKIWLSITRGDPLGTIIVFLPDKTMLRDSCFETFRVSEWGIISDTRIRWREDAIPIEAEVSQPTAHELILKPVGTNREESYVAISVPYVCPDMPR